MPNLMDNSQLQSVPDTNNDDIVQQINRIRQNPRAYEEYLKRTNPQAYNQIMQIRNSPNPRQYILQMAQQRGLNPGILRMLGIM